MEVKKVTIVGNSTGVLISKKVLAELGLRRGQYVYITVKNKKIIIQGARVLNKRLGRL